MGFVPGLAPNLKRAGVNDIGGGALDEIHDVVESCSKVELIILLLNIANVGCANAVLQA